MPINATLTALENLLALINAANTTQVMTPSEVSTGAPVINATGLNTSVIVTSLANEGFTGAVTVNYNRRGLTDSVVTPNFTLAGVTINDTNATVLAKIAAQLGLVASELTFTGALNYMGPGGSSTGSIASNPGSLLYIDGSNQVITLNWVAIPMSTAVTNLNLAGFTAV